MIEIPQPTRPSLSGYVESGKLLPWRWVDVRMNEARSYWIATRSPGYPSSRPVWGIWRDAALYFSTGSAIGRHILSDSRVQVNLESANELVILEGHARPMAAGDVEFWVSAYKDKYSWDMPASTEGVFVVVPSRILAWMCDPSGQDGGVLVSNSATEWIFASTPC